MSTDPRVALLQALDKYIEAMDLIESVSPKTLLRILEAAIRAPAPLAQAAFGDSQPVARRCTWDCDALAIAAENGYVHPDDHPGLKEWLAASPQRVPDPPIPESTQGDTARCSRLDSSVRLADALDCDNPTYQRGYCDGQAYVVDTCRQYLKEDELPHERIERDHRDSLALMGLLAKEKFRVEWLLHHVSGAELRRLGVRTNGDRDYALASLDAARSRTSEGAGAQGVSQAAQPDKPEPESWQGRSEVDR